MDLGRQKQKLEIFESFLSDLSTLSTCKRLKCSCVIVPDDFSRVESIGYNGQPKGCSHDHCSGEVGTCGCVHAEANALIKLQREGPRNLLLLTQVSPCVHCAGLIINHGRIQRVMYGMLYRDQTGLFRLREAGIDAIEL